MKKLTTIFALILLFATGSAAQDLDEKYAAGLLKAGTQAPEFSISGTDNNLNKPLSSLRGRIVVLDFWATWCPDCRKEIPNMKALYEKFAPRGVEFIGVSFDKDPAVLSRYVSENGIKWAQHCEYKPWKETKISADYNIKWIPSIYVIDGEGKVVLGTVMGEKLEAKLNELTAGNACGNHCNKNGARCNHSGSRDKDKSHDGDKHCCTK